MPYYRFTEEQLEYANHVNIIEYARRHGYTVKEYHRGYWKIPGYGGLLLEPDKWYWELEHRGGGPIQFVMVIEHMTWVEAVKKLLSESNPEYLYHPTETSLPPKQGSKRKDKTNFRLPAKNTTYEHIFAYLIKTRRLDQHLVQQLVKEKKLYEDVNQNCVFVGYDQTGIPRSAFIRGTKPHRPYKGDAAGSDKRFGFAIEGGTKTLYVFESAIDLISYQTLLKEAGKEIKDHYISLAGISLAALEEYLSWHRDIQKIVVCTDYDESGIEAFEQIKEIYGLLYKIKRQSSKPYKDFNKYLLQKYLNDCLKEQGLQTVPLSNAAGPP